MSGNESRPGRSVVSKFSAILMTFRQGGEHNLSEIANLSGLPISTAHRMVSDLTDWLVLERDSDGRTYRPGAALQSLVGSTRCHNRSLRDRAAPWLEDVHRAVNSDVRLHVLRRGTVRYIEKRRGCPVTHFSAAATVPAHATAGGKVLLAFTPDQERHRERDTRLIAYTPRTIVDPDQLRWVVRKVRINGFAVADRELRSDSTVIGAPVFGPGGRIAAAIELEVEDLANAFESSWPALSVAAAGLSRELDRPCRTCHDLDSAETLCAARPPDAGERQTVERTGAPDYSLRVALGTGRQGPRSW